MKQQLENDLGLEQAALTVLRPGTKTCLDGRDDATRELLEHMIVDEEEHINWIEAQVHQIKERWATKIIWRSNTEEKLAANQRLIFSVQRIPFRCTKDNDAMWRVRLNFSSPLAPGFSSKCVTSNT